MRQVGTRGGAGWRCALLLLAALPARAAEPPRLALVISNAGYRSLPPVPACQASASLLAAALRRAGWPVTELRDPSNGQMGAAIGTVGDALDAPEPPATFVYACGFAATFERRLFLLPASATLARETDVLTAGLVAAALTGPIARSKVPAGLVALDLIPLPGSPAIPPDTAQLRAPASRTGILAVANPGPGPSGPTPLALALASALAQSSLTVAGLQAEVRQALAGSRGPDLLAQQPAEPAWLQGEAPAPQAVVPEAKPEPAPQPAPAPAVPQASPPDEIAALGDLDRRRVQLALQRLGYYAGKVDGVLGSDTLAAIRRYQHELGAAMTGRLTQSQAARLLARP